MVRVVALVVSLSLVAIFVTIFIGAVRNARALRRDLNQRFDDVQRRLEEQANALADELLSRTKDSTD
jgi:hypothetical protein